MLSEAQEQYRRFEHDSWERAAQYYADSFACVTAPFARPLLDAVGCAPGMRVLDVASGTGYISDLAMDRGADLIAIDFSAAMVAEAKKHYPCIAFSAGDAESLPFPDQHFDAVVIGFGMQHFPSPRRAVSEARRVLRGGGKFAFTVWSSSDNRFQQVLIDAISEVGLGSSSLPAAPNGEFNGPEACLSLLKEGGFNLEASTAQKLEAHIRVPSAERVFEITAKGTARGAALIRSQPEDAVPAIIAGLRKALKPYRREDGEGYDVPALAILSIVARQ